MFKPWRRVVYFDPATAAELHFPSEMKLSRGISSSGCTEMHRERETMPSTIIRFAAESPLKISHLYLRNLRAKLDLLLLSHLKYNFKTKKKKKCTFGNIYG